VFPNVTFPNHGDNKEDEFGFTPDFDFPETPIYLEFDLFKAFFGSVWKQDALCKTPNAEHLDKFYPEAGVHGGNHLAAPRKLCLECPVRYECLEEGIDEPFGVWGGHSPSQRRRISSMLKKGSSLIEASQFIDQRSRDARRPE